MEDQETGVRTAGVGVERIVGRLILAQPWNENSLKLTTMPRFASSFLRSFDLYDDIN